MTVIGWSPVMSEARGYCVDGASALDAATLVRRRSAPEEQLRIVAVYEGRHGLLLIQQAVEKARTMASPGSESPERQRDYTVVAFWANSGEVLAPVKAFERSGDPVVAMAKVLARHDRTGRDLQIIAALAGRHRPILTAENLPVEW